MFVCGDCKSFYDCEVGFDSMACENFDNVKEQVVVQQTDEERIIARIDSLTKRADELESRFNEVMAAIVKAAVSE